MILGVAVDRRKIGLYIYLLWGLEFSFRLIKIFTRPFPVSCLHPDLPAKRQSVWCRRV